MDTFWNPEECPSRDLPISTLENALTPMRSRSSPKGSIMTTPSSDSVRKVANPETVLGKISNAESTPIMSELDGVSESFPRLRVVHGDTEQHSDQLDQPLEVPQQIAELTGHLRRRHDDLIAKEATLNDKIQSWLTNIDAQSAANTDRERKLKLREQQLRSLQFHLLQMQNDIVDSQLSMEKVIEHFENTESDEYMRLALELLRFEVLDRFDYVSKRWELLHEKLENLYQPKPLRRAA